MAEPTRSRRRAAVVVALAAFLTACRFPVMPNRFLTLSVEKQGDSILFTSSELAEACPEGVLVFNFSVGEKGCTLSCTRWQVTQTSRPSPTDPMVALPIVYAADVPRTDVQHAPQALGPGSYSVGAELGCYRRGDLVYEQAFGGFDIRPDGALVESGISGQR